MLKWKEHVDLMEEERLPLKVREEKERYGQTCLIRAMKKEKELKETPKSTRYTYFAQKPYLFKRNQLQKET